MTGGAIFCADLGVTNSILTWVDQQPGGDKAAHFLLLAVLAFTLNVALRGRTWRGGLQLGGVIVAVVITLEELSQLWIPGRHFDWGDLLANFAGILSADWLARRVLR